MKGKKSKRKKSVEMEVPFSRDYIDRNSLSRIKM